jgi:hypothetical protein
VLAVAGQAGQMNAAFWNAETYQPWTDAYAGWVTSVPTWSTGGTQPVTGNGTRDGAYKLLGGYGKTVLYWFRVTFGTTTTYGTSGWNISLPFTANGRTEQIGALRYANGSGNYMVGQLVVAASGSLCSLWVPSAATSTYLSGITNAAPTPTPASGGGFTGQLIYERP